MTQVVVRPAADGDSAALTDLLDQLGYPATPGVMPARLQRLLSNHNAAALVAVRDGRVIGLATMHIISPLNRAHDVAWLTTLVVDAANRGTGAGRALVKAVEAHARMHGCERLTVTTHEDRSDANAFYQRIGFQLTGRRFGMTLD